MASHVVVRDFSARRATVKTQPGTYLSDVLDEACKKLKLSPELYSLKHNNKPVDLSRTIRLSGLPSGAQLELVQASKSATAVNVALQLPASENNRRLTEKLPSTTSLWQILRHFESKNSLNFTQRGTLQMEDGGSGAGRLCYEMPVVDALGRQMGSFLDLQRTLSQLGITSGNALLRLNFKSSGQPLEEAMVQISQYFKEIEESSAFPGAHAESGGQSQSATNAEKAPGPDAVMINANQRGPEPRKYDQSEKEKGEADSTTAQFTVVPETQLVADVINPISIGRPAQVFHAPTSSTPTAAKLPFNEADYEPGIVHAQLHQARLNRESRNKRLLSDAELAAQEQERQATMSKVNNVKARIRLPDQDAIVIEFTRNDTGEDVYTEVRSRMESPAAPFRLMYYGDNAQHVLLEEAPKKLVSQFGWRGAMQVNMLWDDNVPANIRNQPSLSAEWRSRRQHLAPIKQPAWQETSDSIDQSGKSKVKQSGDRPTAGVEEKLKKFLFGKKK